MLGKVDLIAFVPTRDFQTSRAFYEHVLGLKFISQDLFAMVFGANGVMVRIVNVSNVGDFKPFPFTLLGWHVTNVEDAVRELATRGVVFERFAGLQQDAQGVWQSPGGAKVAWFKDPDGNVLSVTEF